MARKRGYSRLRLLDITTEAKITHQGFYGHFANKRHSVAVATSDELGTIADLAMRGSQRDEAWAARLLADIDRALIEAYPAKDGPEVWLRDHLTAAFEAEGGYSALRINELIKISKLGHGEFYRRYGGKLGCLRRIYADVLAELRSELLDNARADSAMSRIGQTFSSDPDRGRFLILGASHLPERIEEDMAAQGSLLALLGAVIASELRTDSSNRLALVLAGGALEVIRSAVLSGSLQGLADELLELEPVSISPVSHEPALRAA